MEKNQIYLIHGQNYMEMTIKLLESVRIEQDIGNKNKKIGLKPNLVVSQPAHYGATTHTEIVEGAIIYLQSKGYKNISVIEGSWVGDRTSEAFKNCGYHRLEQEYGIRLIDTQKDSYSTYQAAGLELDVCDKAMEMDYMINIPVMKGHCQTNITCALKNNKGLIPNSEKRRYHTMYLHEPIAALNKIVRNDFILVDNICGDLDFEEGGNPVTMNRIIGFKDPVLCDAFVCDTMGYTIDEVEYIRLAESHGVGCADTSSAEVIELNKSEIGIGDIPVTRKVKALSGYVNEKNACSACYGSLIYALDRLKEEGILLKEPVCIGQGFQGKSGKAGVGKCTSNFKLSLKGCPPKGIDIVKFLKEYNG